jgi:hypothetical protein
MNDIQRLQGIYGATGRELRRVLLVIDPANYSDARAADARAKTGEMVRGLNVAADRWTTESIGKAYAKSARIAKTSLQILGRKPRRRTWDDKRRRLADDLMIMLLRANNSIRGTVDKYLASVALAARTARTAQVREYLYADSAADIGRIADNAVRNELSRGSLSSQLRDYLWGLVHDDAFIEIACVDGAIRTYQMKKYADLVARTTLADAATAATLDLCAEYENDLVQWDNPLNPCEECAPHVGQVYSISGNDPDYPPLEDEPPVHPNCECGLLPTSPEAIAVKGERG